MIRSRKRTLLEWAFIIGIFLFLTQTPYGTQVQSWLQRGILWTGILQPDVELAEEEYSEANFDVPLVSLSGEAVSMEDFRGKVIFMNVWATWCAPCLAEMPFIQKLYDELGDDRIVFLMISTDDSRETTGKFIESKDYTFPVYHLSGRMPAPYTSNSIPTTYIISPEEQLVAVHAGMANYASAKFKTFLLGLAERVAVSL